MKRVGNGRKAFTVHFGFQHTLTQQIHTTQLRHYSLEVQLAHSDQPKQGCISCDFFTEIEYERTIHCQQV